MKLQLVNFDTAKDLKELGFDWPCYAVWNDFRPYLGNEPSEPYCVHFGIHQNDKNRKGCPDEYSAPEQAFATKWLREVYHIYIIPNRWSNGMTDRIQRHHLTVDPQSELIKFGMWRVDILVEDPDKDDWKKTITAFADTYEEAEAEGIRRAIKYLKSNENS